MHQLWNGIAQNYKDFDDIWQKYSKYFRIEFVCFSFHVGLLVVKLSSLKLHNENNARMLLLTTGSVMHFRHFWWCNAGRILTRKPSYRWQTRATRKPAKIASIQRAYNVVADNTGLLYLHAFNCYCVRNPRNPEKFTENSNLWSSRSSKVIDLGANRKPICDLLLVINSNFSRICYSFRDIHG